MHANRVLLALARLFGVSVVTPRYGYLSQAKVKSFWKTMYSLEFDEDGKGTLFDVRFVLDAWLKWVGNDATSMAGA